ncbi:hypothetical protein N9Y32_00860 [Candidatus Thioglobus sp.]|nr:hypothetical protein [Candidatus Thioglobus sp.]MDC0920480.1 hypothetical protein [Candidatus Thioglobus sp.]
MFIINIIIALVIFLTSALMTWTSGIDISVGNYLWLPMGAKILAFLLFGFWALPGVLLGSLMSGYILYNFLNVDPIYGPLGSLIGAFAPMGAILIMRYFNLSTFFDSDKKLEFRHVIFLIVLSSIINTIFKLFLYFGKVSGVDDQQIDSPEFILSYLTGDILGGVVFILLTIKIVMPILLRFKLI